MNLKNFIFFIVIICAGISCKKECDDPNVENDVNTSQLPPATMTGANTMGCLINGEVWLPLSRNILGDLIYNINFSVSSISSGGGFSIQGIREIDDDFAIILVSSSDVLTPGIYPYLLPTDRFLDSCGVFDLDTTYNNFIEVTRIDFDEEILSGLYQMRVVDDGCDTLTITEGRFDLSP